MRNEGTVLWLNETKGPMGTRWRLATGLGRRPRAKLMT
jgi:hypothetical protein